MAIQVFSKGDKLPPLPSGLEDIKTQHLISRYGYKIVDLDGTLFWEAATEDDFRASEAERLGISRDEVELRTSCYQTGPRSCSGFCDSGFCNLVFNAPGNYYYCACT